MKTFLCYLRFLRISYFFVSMEGASKGTCELAFLYISLTRFRLQRDYEMRRGDKCATLKNYFVISSIYLHDSQLQLFRKRGEKKEGKAENERKNFLNLISQFLLLLWNNLPERKTFVLAVGSKRFFCLFFSSLSRLISVVH